MAVCCVKILMGVWLSDNECGQTSHARDNGSCTLDKRATLFRPKKLLLTAALAGNLEVLLRVDSGLDCIHPFRSICSAPHLTRT